MFFSCAVPRARLLSTGSCRRQSQAETEGYSGNVNARALSTQDEDYVLPCTLLLLEAISASVQRCLARVLHAPVPNTHTGAITVTVDHNLGLQNLLLHHVHAMVKLCQQSSGHFNRVGNTWDIQPSAFRYITDTVVCGRLAFMLQKQANWSGLLQALDVAYKTVRSSPATSPLHAIQSVEFVPSMQLQPAGAYTG